MGKNKNQDLVPSANGREKTSSVRSVQEILSKWLSVYSEHYGKEISAANATVYQRALADLEPAELDAACLEALSGCRFMPTVADIRAHIKHITAVEEASECDAEWSSILARIWAWDEYYNTWGYSGPPQLSSAGHYAVRQCGGFTAIQQTEPKHLPLLKKTFDETYHRNLENNKHLELPPGTEIKFLN